MFFFSVIGAIQMRYDDDDDSQPNNQPNLMRHSPSCAEEKKEHIAFWYERGMCEANDLYAQQLINAQLNTGPGPGSALHSAHSRSPISTCINQLDRLRSGA